ncbi:MAG TPA: DNA alkylation repair protein [Phycisphaerae bacterium]|nr:DNA alkylation repair protein [Phycisphaerae bacterium]
MRRKKKPSRDNQTLKKEPRRSPRVEAGAVLASLKRLASKKTREEMGPRYGVHTDRAFGVPVGKIQQLGKRLGRSHELAAELWKSGWYEARMLAAFVDEPLRVTPAQMDRWCRDFDNWGICDTVCFKLFDQVPAAIAFRKVGQWSREKGEFQKRAAFALLACVALHDKTTGDAPFVRSLSLIERAATDERNFVKKAVSWALRSIGQRSSKLHTLAMATSKRLAASSTAAARWVGKDALRDLSRPAAERRIQSRDR